MGIFGIKTKKEKQAEARATEAKNESELLDRIKYWDYHKCYEELEAYEKGNREHFSSRVVKAIKNRKQDLAYESGLNSKKSDLDRKIAEKEAEIQRLKNRDPWSYSGSDGYYFKTRSFKSDEKMAAEVKAAEAELSRLKRERANVGKEW